ncbi:nuclease (plasmid) [Candidatus Photodesmus katoptron]|uniref:Putative nuclease n=1 Tax=Candidatus Photodesmus katoptron Akat1 TaxID=1236703 RepID=S3DJ69_9GAMM|nr:thermonuclease family protein [Candidatus Photodesmus katoptron]EPE37189.1 putative nuclease [Candidatus Photodesmus katoptron Akat1]KEY90061.1 nuclease [Candidatus Photodesmus katoptron]
MSIKIIALIIVLLFNNNVFAKKNETYGTLKITEITSVFDGDTFRANIHNVHSLIGNKIPIRVAGIDTPEIRGKCKKEKTLAKLAKQFTVNFLNSKDIIELRNVKRGKYFRIVADVYVGNKNLSEYLIHSGLAVYYDGGVKSKNWCL